mmetsp:Transcript_79362/g.227685  ORF Transcript_79362/g.227685 Transcript_79362/m.227685 type:complete len:258 (-) Transcript_79362:442-1215(-)
MLGGVNASFHSFTKVVFDQTQGLLCTHIALFVAFQSVAQHGWRVTIANTENSFCALGNTLDELNLVGTYNPATIAFGHKMQGSVILVWDPIILWATNEQYMLHAVGGSGHRKIQGDTIVPTPNHLFGPLAALNIRFVQWAQAVVDRQHLEDTSFAEASEQPPTAGHSESDVRTIVQCQVTGLMPIDHEHRTLGCTDDNLHVTGIFMRWRQDTEADRCLGNTQLCTPLACIARLCDRVVHEETELPSQQSDTVRPNRC